MSPLRRVHLLVATALAVATTACGGGTADPSPPAPPPAPAPPPPPPAPPPAPAPVASVTVSVDTVSVAIGGTVQIAVTLKDAQGAVLSGRTVTWASTAPAVASVSSSGLVTAVQVGRASVVALSEGKSDTATVLVPPAPVQITLQNGAAQTATIGAAGGTIVATGAGAITYTLVVPPLALMQPVAITMTPLGSVTGLPLSGGFVAGADFQPSGLAFAKPAALTITTNPQPGANQRLIGFTYQGNGQALGLAPAKGAAGSITLSVLHFSGVGAGFGTTQDIDALYFGSNPPPTSGQFYFDFLVIALNDNPHRFELGLMQDWFDKVILPLLNAVSTDAQLVAAMGAYGDWQYDTPDLLDTYSFIPGGKNAPTLVSRRTQWEQLFVVKVKQAIAGNEQICAAPGLASARLAALDNTLFWYRIARIGVGVATVQNGLDLPTFQAGLCARSVTENLTLSDPLANSANTLDATFKLIFTGGQLVMPANFFVTATASGATLALPDATALTPPGFLTGSVTPSSASASVTIDLKACYVGSMNTGLALGSTVDEICHTEHIVRTPPVPFVISGRFVSFQTHPGESHPPQDYTATVPANLTQFLPVVWSATGLPANATIVSTGPASARVSGCLDVEGVFPITIHARLGAITVDAPTYTVNVKHNPSGRSPCP